VSKQAKRSNILSEMTKRRHYRWGGENDWSDESSGVSKRVMAAPAWHSAAWCSTAGK